jgi:glutaryl-CoA dehydrogenase
VFNWPIGGHQLTQRKLADTARGLRKGILLALHLGAVTGAGRLKPAQISLNNDREAIAIAPPVPTSWEPTSSPWNTP